MPETTRQVITLLTDFGYEDYFVAAVKGVILSANPDAVLVDISHGIRPQGVFQAGYVLAAAYSCFPPGTIHTVVVDPGVGSKRRVIAAELDGHTFVVPDNGLLTPALRRGSLTRAVSVSHREIFRRPVSATFHGRDIFAPVAAHLSLGNDLDTLGERVDDIATLDMPAVTLTRAGEVCGEVVSVDHFGNLITNITAEDLAVFTGQDGSCDCVVKFGKARRCHFYRTYSSAPADTLLALIDSLGLLEIAVSMGNAAEKTGCGTGTEVTVAESS